MGILLDKIQKLSGSDSSDSPKTNSDDISTLRKRSENAQKRKDSVHKLQNLRTAQTPERTPHKAFGESENLSGASAEYEKGRPAVQDADSINQSKLVSLAVQFCTHEHGLEVDPEEVAALVPPSDWRDANDCSPDELKAWAAALAMRAVRYCGQVPAGWDQVAHCRHCGPVYSFVSGDCLACPWCEMRRAGKRFPAPDKEQD